MAVLPLLLILATPGAEETDRRIARFESPGRAAWQKPAQVVATLRIPERAVVADIGSGSGYFTLPFARAVGHHGWVYAADVSAQMLRYVTRRAREEKAPMIRTVLAEPDDPKLPTPVDLVFMCNTLHHVRDPQAYLKTLRRYLNPDSRVVIIDYRLAKTPVGPPISMRISEDDLIALSRRAGYVLRRRYAFLPHQYFVELIALDLQTARSSTASDGAR